jgi:DNA polymerase-1
MSGLERLPEPGAPDALYVLDLSSWARGIYEGIRGRAAPERRGDVDNPESVAVAHIVSRRFVDAVLVDRKPAFLAVALDMIGDTPSRASIWPGYKAGRTPPGPGYARQVGILLDVFLAHRIPCFQGSGFEADDFIGAITRRARKAALRVVILSKDHDLWQLFESADPTGVVAWDVAGDKVYGAADVVSHYGVVPEKLVDLMALAGDKDEAPGVDGIGEKKAAVLLNKYETLETTLERWQWLLPNKMAAMLRDGAESARLSKKLVTLLDAPVSCSLQGLAVGWTAEEAKAIDALGVKHHLPVLRDVIAYPKPEIDPGLAERWLAACAEGGSP